MNIDNLIKEAILEANPAKRDAYRAIKAESDKKELTDTDIILITKKLAKIKEEDITMYQTNLTPEREKVLHNYQEQLKYLQELIPEDINPSIIEEYIVTAYPNGYTKKQMSSIIKEVKFQYPLAEGKVVANLVKQHII